MYPEDIEGQFIQVYDLNITCYLVRTCVSHSQDLNTVQSSSKIGSEIMKTINHRKNIPDSNITFVEALF